MGARVEAPGKGLARLSGGTRSRHRPDQSGADGREPGPDEQPSAADARVQSELGTEQPALGEAREQLSNILIYQ